MENPKKQNGKKRQATDSNIGSDELSSESESESESEMDCDEEEHIDIEFEAQTPIESDFHGIKQLLNRLFLMLHLDLSEMTDLIISQTSVGSTVKVVDDEEDGIYGITSVLSLNKHKDKCCMKELKKGILSKCKSSASDRCQSLENIFDKKNVGFLINERYINIPPQIAIPFHKSLRSEVEEAISEDVAFKLDYLLLISKTLRPTKAPQEVDASNGRNISKHSKTKRKKKGRTKEEFKPDHVEYTNFEDEIFHKACEMSFSYSVTEATGLAIGGRWDFGDQLMNTYRTVMLIPANKWDQIISDVEELLD